MTQEVEVPGVGTLQFPDGMSQPDMAAAIQKNFPQIHAPKAPPAPAVPPPTGAQHASDVLGIVKQHPFTSGIGLAENALSGVTGGVGSLADALTGSDPGAHDFAYRPRTEAGKAIAGASADEGAAVGRGYDKVAGTGPLAATLKERVPEALGAVSTVTGLAAAPRGLGAIGGGIKAVRTPAYLPKGISAQAALDTAAANSPQSMGAAAAAPRVTGATPELQQAIVKTARQTGGAVNPEALQRHLEANTLPVRIDLMEGQATRDPALYSEEMNLRGKHTGLAEHINTQNSNLVKNVQALREQVGPDVFSKDTPAHGDTLIGAYRDLDAARTADIKARYQALKDANGGQFPVDGQAFVTSADQALAQEMKARYVPSEIKADLADFREGKAMTFTHFENLRTNLAAEGRKAERAGDGNAEAAINIVRSQLESLPMSAETAQIKPLADAARSAARARFDAMRDDPAYKAAVNETVAPDDFVRKFVINGKRDHVATMAEALRDNDTARQTLAVSVLDHLRDSAGIGPDYKGAFRQSGWNKALQSIDPKLQSLVDPKAAETFQQLGNVAHNVQVAPPGHTVNSSNTLSAGMAEYAGGALEDAVNKKAWGIPLGTVGRKVIQHVKHGSRVRQATEPGAGLGRLGNVGTRH